MLLLEPVARSGHSHEELRAVLVALAVICHRNNPSVREGESLVQLVQEGATENTFSPLACPCGVSPLNHEVFDDPMEDSLVIVALQTELDEVANGARGLPGP